MLSKISKTTNLSATSTAGEGGSVVMYMNATVSEDGNVNITQMIQDKILYQANAEAVNADFDSFRAAVMQETEE